jgi:hypothetical protein
MMVFRGQIEKAGHFLQPATIAIGHRVMMILLNGGNGNRIHGFATGHMNR